MTDNRTVCINAEYVPWEKATVHLMCHSMGRGSAIFEVLGFHNTEIGSSIFRLDEHINRLFRTAELLSMEIPLARNDLCDAITTTVRRNGLGEGYIKIIGYYPQIAFEILPPQKEIDIAIFVLGPHDVPVDPAFENGTSVCISQWMKLDPRTVPIEAKVAANYLNGMMARIEARDRGFDFAVMLDTHGYITEGGTESIFLVKDNTLMTPSLGSVLDSITRKSLLHVAETIGIATFEGKLLPELCFEADEIFLSGTPAKLVPVRQFDEKTLGNTPGPLTRTLSDAMDTILKGHDERFKDWLFPV